MFKKAESGIGTLIVFIAMILVAAVAAGVLIQTSSGLQSKSLDIGKKTTDEVSKSIDIIQVFADVESSGYIRNLTCVVRLTPGSEAEKIDNLFANLQLSDNTIKYEYGSGLNCNGSDSSVFACNYSASFIKESDNHLSGYILEGEVVEISFIAPRNIGESEVLTALWRVNEGLSKTVSITTPSSIGGNKVYLYP